MKRPSAKTEKEFQRMPVAAPEVDVERLPECEPNAERMMEMIRRLYPLHRTLVSDGTDTALEIIGEYLHSQLGYRILSFPSGQKVWTWTVPERYVVRTAYIDVVHNGTRRRIADFAQHPLHLVSYSTRSIA